MDINEMQRVLKKTIFMFVKKEKVVGKGINMNPVLSCSPHQGANEPGILVTG